VELAEGSPGIEVDKPISKRSIFSRNVLKRASKENQDIRKFASVPNEDMTEEVFDF